MANNEFKKLESERPPFDLRDFRFEQTPDPDWQPGTGANNKVGDNSWRDHDKQEIDPYVETRSPVDNYKLLISGIVPRPIGFLVTKTETGVNNVAPFSFTSLACHDPPIFTVGVSGGPGRYKDTREILLNTKECTLNMISEWFIEAANYTATNSPPGIDETDLAGLHTLPSSKVVPPHIQESAFSVECKVIHHHVWHSRTTGKETGTLFILEGVNFHVRQDMLNEQHNMIDVAKYKPVSRLGGIMYGRTTHTYELPRPDYDEEVQVGNIKTGDNKNNPHM